MSDVKGPWGNVTSDTRAPQAYVVYAPMKGKFAALPLDKNEVAPAIYARIAHTENNHPTRQHAKMLKPGDIDYIRIAQAISEDDAIEKAKAAGFAHGQPNMSKGPWTKPAA